MTAIRVDDEHVRRPGLNSDHFQQADTDQDGKLSRDEAWSLATKWYPAMFQK